MQRKCIWTLVILSLVLMSAGCKDASEPDKSQAPDQAKPKLKVFDVATYGGKADGQTDNSPAISKAIAAAAEAGGGRILIPAAEKPYIITDSIALQSNNLHVMGTGATVYLKDGSATGRTTQENMLHLVKIRGTKEAPIENISVVGLTIDANYWGQTGNTAAWQASAKIAGITRGIKVDHARNVLIDKVAIKRSFVGMTFGLGSHNCEARDVKVTQFHHDAFGVTPDRTDGGASNISFIRCVASDSLNGRNGGLPGTRVKGWEIEEGAHDVKLVDCAVRDTSANGFYVRPHWTRASMKYHTKNIEFIRCRVERAGKAAFMAKGFNHLQKVVNVKFIDCYSDTGYFLSVMNTENIVISGGHFGSLTLGYYPDIADDHHFPDGGWPWTYHYLPIRSITVENVTIAGDVRINAAPGNDAAEDYTPEIVFNKLAIKGDIYIVGSKSVVKMSDSTVAGTEYVMTTEEYLEKIIKPAKP